MYMQYCQSFYQGGMNPMMNPQMPNYMNQPFNSFSQKGTPTPPSFGLGSNGGMNNENFPQILNNSLN